VVTSQGSEGIIYPGGSQQLVTWAVNGTDSPPVNTQNVTIRLSTDGGYTYPDILLASTPNTGSATVTLPNISTEVARIKVAAVDNIYFDINTTDFGIELSSASAEQRLRDATVRVYPNPAKGSFTLYLPDRLDFRVRVFDVKGALLVEQFNANRIELADFPAGMYLLEVTDLGTNQRVTKKLVVTQ
jgi:hypothetical protein